MIRLATHGDRSAICVLSPLRKNVVNDLIAVDIETDYRGGIVEIALVTDAGTLIHCPVNPGYPTGDIFARKGLPDSLLARACPMDELAPLIGDMVRGSWVIAWNASYDRRFLTPVLSTSFGLRCAMSRFDPYRGDYVMQYGSFHKTKLTHAMKLLGFDYDAPGPHRAEPDAKAALEVWRWMDEHPLEMPKDVTANEPAIAAIVAKG